ncbi:hypothetical protein KAW18_07150 [candidate division WOR-3 bacterium]|nr:hypothetical protein [candidate division WOR-3 bacterium]
MIIESAFFKTVATLIRQVGQKANEERIRGILLEKIYEEYQMAYWDKSTVYSQCNYDYARNKKCDLKVVLGNLRGAELLGDYNIATENWIEIKYFNEQGAKKIKKEIIKDLLRLCIFVGEHQGEIRDKGRYFLFVSRKDPQKNEDKLIKKIFTPGSCKISIDSDELDNAFTYFKLDIYSYQIVPCNTPEFRSNYFASLSRIDGFEIKKNNDIFKYKPHFKSTDVKVHKEFARLYEKNKK